MPILNDEELATFRTLLCSGTCGVDSSFGTSDSQTASGSRIATEGMTDAERLNFCRHSHSISWQRRNPYRYLYSPNLCPDIEFIRRNSRMTLVKRCTRGRTCPYAHSKEEELYHPMVYKTKLCRIYPNCRRHFCPFAHTSEELRPRMNAEAYRNAHIDFLAKHDKWHGYRGTKSPQTSTLTTEASTQSFYERPIGAQDSWKPLTSPADAPPAPHKFQNLQLGPAGGRHHGLGWANEVGKHQYRPRPEGERRYRTPHRPLSPSQLLAEPAGPTQQAGRTPPSSPVAMPRELRPDAEHLEAEKPSVAPPQPRAIGQSQQESGELPPGLSESAVSALKNADSALLLQTLDLILVRLACSADAQGAYNFGTQEQCATAAEQGSRSAALSDDKERRANGQSGETQGYQGHQGNQGHQSQWSQAGSPVFPIEVCDDDHPQKFSQGTFAATGKNESPAEVAKKLARQGLLEGLFGGAYLESYAQRDQDGHPCPLETAKF